MTRPSSYVVYATHPLHRDVLPLSFASHAMGEEALTEAWEYLDSPKFQVWLVSPAGELLGYRAAR